MSIIFFKSLTRPSDRTTRFGRQLRARRIPAASQMQSHGGATFHDRMGCKIYVSGNS